MTTPNIDTGITERVKPIRLSSGVCWRCEISLAGGGTVLTPVFDYVPDGRPYTEIEIGSASVVRIPSRRCYITHHHPADNIGARLQVFHLIDNGGQLSPVTLYGCGGVGGRMNIWEYELRGRRCQFRLQNVPLGTSAGVAGTQYLELTWGGPDA